MKKNDLMFVMQRIDTTIEITNNKAALLLGFNTFLIGAMVSMITKIKNFVDSNFILLILSVFIISSLFVSCVLSILAIIPKLKYHDKGHEYRSLIFFGSIAKLKTEDFHDYTKNTTEIDFEKDIKIQIVQLARIASEKYAKLTSSIYCILFGFILPMCLGLLVVVLGGV